MAASIDLFKTSDRDETIENVDTTSGTDPEVVITEAMCFRRNDPDNPNDGILLFVAYLDAVVPASNGIDGGGWRARLYLRNDGSGEINYTYNAALNPGTTHTPTLAQLLASTSGDELHNSGNTANPWAGSINGALPAGLTLQSVIISGGADHLIPLGGGAWVSFGGFFGNLAAVAAAEFYHNPDGYA